MPAEEKKDPILEEIKAQRRRERWNALLTPFITLASIVISVGMLMFLIQTCQERNPQQPGLRLPIQKMPEPPPPPK
jgi:hypothetical protein